MPTYHHGVTLVEVTEGTRYLRDAKSSTIGMVCTADDADPATFPENSPVLIEGDQTLIDKAGATGTLAASLNAIFDQCAPAIVVTRVPEGADDAEKTANLIAGLETLKTAKASLGISPRILGVPGLDNQSVAAELVSLADALRGFAYLSAFGATTKEEAVTYRENFGSKRAMVIWPAFQVWDSVALATVERNPIAHALGLRALLDYEQGVQKTLSNIAVNGVTGITPPIHWDLRSPDTVAGYLNANEVTVLIRENGFRFWGSRTCSADPQDAFESFVRTGDKLGDTIADAHLWAIDKPMTRTLVNDLVEGINAKLRELVTNGEIVDGRAWIPQDKNTMETLSNGMLYLDYDYVAIPPLENLQLTQRINSSYLVQLVAS